MTLSLAVVCEGKGDRSTACDLADRIFCENVPWLESDVLEYNRRWQGAEPDSDFLKWSNVKQAAKDKGIPLLCQFQDPPARPDAATARKALLVLMASDSPPDGIFLIRDSDNDLERREGLQQAKRDSKFSVPIVIGVAHPKREAWVLVGFEPLGEKEQDLIKKLRQELGFQPHTDAHRLTAKHINDKNSAKRVLAALTQDDHDREAQCWRETSLDTLRSRGEPSGLTDYLEQVKDLIVPLFRKSG